MAPSGGERAERTSARPADGCHLAPVDAGDRDGAAGVRSVHELAAAEVDADVADRRVIEDEVTGLGVTRRYVRSGGGLGSGVAGQVHARLTPRIVRQTGAVESDTWVGHRVPVGHPDLTQRGVDRST